MPIYELILVLKVGFPLPLSRHVPLSSPAHRLAGKPALGIVPLVLLFLYNSRALMYERTV